MTTYIGAVEAARILNVAPATLYAYVSRGRITRRSAADGRASLFALDEVEALVARGRRATTGPRPTIDVRIASSITTLGEEGVSIRGHDLTELVREHGFESVAELLWTSQLPPPDLHWLAVGRADRLALAPVVALAIDPVAKIATAAHLLGELHPDDGAATAARRLLVCTPALLGSTRRTGPLAHRLASAWMRRPTPALISAIDTAMALLADHELATSTLAVRIAASVRSSPYQAFASGLATVQGALHGAASQHVHRLLERCAETSVVEEIARLRASRERVPGFGHKVYRGQDPRFDVMLDAVRELAAGSAQIAVVDAVIAEVGRTIPKHPNVDLALGALSWIAGFDPEVPLFAIARIAGWAAHYDEELQAPPVRYRGVS